MPQIDRFTVSLDTELLAAFDRHMAANGYENRSEAIRDLIRDQLANSRLQSPDEAVLATLTLVCEVGLSDSAKRLRTTLAEQSDLVMGTWSAPIDAARDLICILLKGTNGRVKAVVDMIQGMRGISHGHFAAIPTGRMKNNE